MDLEIPVMEAFLPPSLLRTMENVRQCSFLSLLYYPIFSPLLFVISWLSKFNTSCGYVGTMKSKGAQKIEGGPDHWELHWLHLSLCRGRNGTALLSRGGSPVW